MPIASIGSSLWTCPYIVEERHVQLIDLNLSTTKPLGARWIVSAFDYIRDNPAFVKNGFTSTGICVH